MFTSLFIPRVILSTSEGVMFPEMVINTASSSGCTDMTTMPSMVSSLSFTRIRVCSSASDTVTTGSQSCAFSFWVAFLTAFSAGNAFWFNR